MITAELIQAARLIQHGGVVAYATEYCFGFGCDPMNRSAVLRVLRIKRRAPDKGLILIAADVAQLDSYVDTIPAPVLATWPGPHTWILPASRDAPAWITGVHSGVAVRLSAHPVVAALCDACGHALVSTSANLAGDPPARHRDALDPALWRQLDGVVGGETAGLERPTPIRDAVTGAALRE